MILMWYWNLHSKTLVSTGANKSTSSNLAVLAFLGWKRRCFRDKLPFSWHTSTRGRGGRGPGGRKSIEFYRFLHDSWLRPSWVVQDGYKSRCYTWKPWKYHESLLRIFLFVHRYAYTHCILLYIQYMYVYTKIVMEFLVWIPNLKGPWSWKCWVNLSSF